MNDLILLLKQNRTPIQELFAEYAKQTNIANPTNIAACYFNDLLAIVEKDFITAARKECEPNLADCDFFSIIAAAAKAIKAGLVISPASPQAFIVSPFDAMENEAKLILSVKGYRQIALRTNLIEVLGAEIVKQGQIKRFDPIKGHEIDWGLTFPNQKDVGAFAYMKLNNNYSASLYMSDEEVRAWADKYSQDYNDPESRWQTDFPNMAKKTVLKRLLNEHAPTIASEFHLACGDITSESVKQFFEKYGAVPAATQPNTQQPQQEENIKVGSKQSANSDAESDTEPAQKTSPKRNVQAASGKKMPTTDAALRDFAQSVLKGELTVEQVENNSFYEMNDEIIARFHVILEEEKANNEKAKETVSTGEAKTKRTRKKAQQAASEALKEPESGDETATPATETAATSPITPTSEQQEPPATAQTETPTPLEQKTDESPAEQSEPPVNHNIANLIETAFGAASVVVTPTSETPAANETPAAKETQPEKTDKTNSFFDIS